MDRLREPPAMHVSSVHNSYVFVKACNLCDFRDSVLLTGVSPALGTVLALSRCSAGDRYMDG